MEKEKCDVTDRMRLAIKEKLNELHCFSDNDLPDYIMILIANKRSKTHMQKDLTLFLGDDSITFTDWLWELITKFKVGSASKSSKRGSKKKVDTEIKVDNGERKKSADTQVPDQSENIIKQDEAAEIITNVPVKKEMVDETDPDVIDYDTDEQEKALLFPEERDNASTKKIQIVNKISTQKNLEEVVDSSKDATINQQFPVEANEIIILNPLNKEIKEESIVSSDKALVLSHSNKQNIQPGQVQQSYQEKTTASVPHQAAPISSVIRKPLTQKSQMVSKTSLISAKVYPMMHTSQSMYSTSQNPQVHAEDEYDPTKPSIGNMSSVINVLPRKYSGSNALQRNKLLLKAVNDATKSVLNGKSVEEFYKPTPIHQLPSTSSIEIHEERPNSSIRLQDKDYDVDIDTVPFRSSLLHPRLAFERDVLMEAEHDSELIRSLAAYSDMDSEEIEPTYIRSMTEEEEEEDSRSPHFYVTLDGIERISMKRKRVVKKPIEFDMDEEDMVFDSSPVIKKQKVPERCKYWPACKNSSDCSYGHPSVPCKSFPDCNFGDKCLYIHPNCKFDALCSRKDCPFTHASKRKFAPVVAPPSVPPPKTTICKFYPKCTASSCPFIHPKLCRYGIQCRAPSCPFTHFNAPSPSMMKWKSNY